MRLIDADRIKDKLVGFRDYRQVCKIIDNAPSVVTNCENCPSKKFTEDMTEKLAKVMVDNGITDFDEFAKQCGVSYLHQDSITRSDTKI